MSSTQQRRAGRGRACGKVILAGEHAVVYGVPAVAVGIARGAEAEAKPAPSGRRLRLVQEGVTVLEVDADAPLENDLARAFHAILREVPGAWDVEAFAEVPPGGGLGCSAALGVAIARALVPGASIARVCDLAMGWERVFHGNPSGVDAAVSARGGCVLFEKGASIRTVSVASELTLCIGNTGIASGTKAMVDAVARLRERRPSIVEKSFEGIRAIVGNVRVAIEHGDAVALGRLMDLNQMILSGLFVSTEEIEQMCAVARRAGALGAKLTGAGGGGCVVALATNETAPAILRAWKADGFDGFVTRVEPTLAELAEAAP